MGHVIRIDPWTDNWTDWGGAQKVSLTRFGRASQAAEVRSALTTNRRVWALPNLSDVNRLSNDLFA